MTHHVKKISTIVKGNTVSKVLGTAVMVCTLRLWCLNMQNKETIVKQQENATFLEANI
jgi:hypothetical protein